MFDTFRDIVQVMKQTIVTMLFFGLGALLQPIRGQWGPLFVIYFAFQQLKISEAI